MFDSQRPQADDSAPREERRSCHRVPVQVAVFCRNNHGEDQLYWSGQIIDISCGGMQLLSRRKFEPTTLIRVCLAEEAGFSSESIEAVVIRAYQSSEEEWIMGCTLVRDFNEAELANWIERNCMNSEEGLHRNSVHKNTSARSTV
jgi:hypothetical protein